MALAGTEIARALVYGGPWRATVDGIAPLPDELRIGPQSVDLTLGDEMLLVSALTPSSYIDIHDPDTQLIERMELDYEGRFKLHPGDIYLASVREAFDCTMPLRVDGLWAHFYPVVDGRSTAARVGLSVHQTAGRGDHGFKAPFTLELTVMIPLIVRPGDRIAQLFFEPIQGIPEPYSGAYTGQRGPQPAVLGAERFR